MAIAAPLLNCAGMFFKAGEEPLLESEVAGDIRPRVGKDTLMTRLTREKIEARGSSRPKSKLADFANA
jgi:hypothetical protein